MTNSTYRKANTSRNRGHVVLTWFLLVALAFSFTGKLFSANQVQADREITGSLSAVSQSWLSAGGYFHNPLGPEEVVVDLEIIIEPEDEIKQLDNFLPAHFSFTYLSLSLDDILSGLPVTDFRSGTEVPLFILYHSWKTFLH